MDRIRSEDVLHYPLDDKDTRIECFPTDRVANSKAKRINPAYDLDYSKKEKTDV